MSRSAPRTSGRHRSISGAEEEWFGPGMDLMMSLFSLIVGVLALVLWQKAHLANRNAKQDDRIAEMSRKLDEAGKGSPYFSDEQWKTALTRKNSEIQDLNDKIEKLLMEQKKLQEALDKSQVDRAALETKLADLNEQMGKISQDLDTAIKQRGDIKLQPVRNLQRELAMAIADQSGLKTGRIGDDSVELMDTTGNTVMTILNDGYLQTLRFGADTLFESGSHSLSSKAKKLLPVVAKVLAGYRTAFKEIQIHGHADTQEMQRDTNSELSTRRAWMVYGVFVDTLRPWSSIISVSAYGQFKPVTRTPGIPFDLPDLTKSNATPDARALNRRIEVFLIYSTPEESKP